MSAKVKRAGINAGKVIGVFFFITLFVFNIEITFSDYSAGEIDFLGMKISSLNEVKALPVKADDDDNGGRGIGDNRYIGFCQTKYPCSRTEYGIMWVYIHGVPIPATYFVVREGRIWGCVGWCEREGCIVAPCDA